MASSRVQSGGGVLRSGINTNIIRLVDKEYYKQHQEALDNIQFPLYDTEFVYASIRNDAKASFSDYQLTTGRDLSNARSARGRVAFTEDDDRRIIDFVKEYGDTYTYGGTQLYDEMIKRDQVLARHTSSSLASRFRKILYPNMTRAQKATIPKMSPERVQASRVKAVRSKRERASKELSFASSPNKRARDENEKNEVENIEEFASPSRGNQDNELAKAGMEFNPRAHGVVRKLQELTGQHEYVVVHGLLVNNGDVGKAFRYLINPHGYIRNCSPEDEPWTYEEDRKLMSDSRELVEMLVEKRGDAAVTERCNFLD